MTVPSTSQESCGWSPPALPADTPGKRIVDRVLRGPAALYFAVVIALLVAASLLPVRGELAMEGGAALIAGAWCAVNFWRCRHAHCVVTGGGWLALSAFLFAEAGLGRSLIGGTEQLVFLGILVAGLAFEGVWYLLRGSTQVTSA